MALQNLGDLKSDSVSVDVAIFGAGAAGITTAMQLMDSGLSVGLFEGGMTDNPGSLAACYDGQTSDTGYPLMSTRLRYFGGTTNHWGGWCSRLFPIDLEHRADAGSPGWPISYTELETYYPAAERLCEITHDTTPENTRSDLLSGFVEGLFRFSPPTRFGPKYRPALAGSKTTQVFCDANLVSLQSRGSAVTDAQVQTSSGVKKTVRAKRHVLALGGIENARMLLIQQAAGSLEVRGCGLGNYFMDHPGTTLGTLIARDGLRYHRHKEDGSQDGALIMPTLRPSDAWLQESGCPSFFLMVRPAAPDPGLAPEYINTPIVAGKPISEHAVHYSVQANFEPVPVASSKITLTSDRDALGLPKLRLDWRVHERHQEDMRRLQRQLVQDLGTSGLGRFRPRKSLPARFSTQSHHLGTTKMAATAAGGVVDADCRVFGTNNLFIAGSSLFPSAGCVNPTLTIVALASRLADHLQENLT